MAEIVSADRGYADYQRNTDREIPVVILGRGPEGAADRIEVEAASTGLDRCTVRAWQAWVAAVEVTSEPGSPREQPPPPPGTPRLPALAA